MNIFGCLCFKYIICFGAIEIEIDIDLMGDFWSDWLGQTGSGVERFGFVRDKDNALYINNTEFCEDMADEHWVPLKEVF